MRKFCLLLFFAVLLFSLSVDADSVENSCYFSVSPSKPEIKPDESFGLDISCDAEVPVSSFLITVEYEEEAVEFLGCEKGEVLKEGYSNYYDSGGKVSFVFTAKASYLIQGEDLNCLEIRFKSRDSVGTEALDFLVEITQVVGEDGETVCSDSSISETVWIQGPGSSEAQLLDLYSEQGVLNEEFRSDVKEYTMDVPYEVSRVEFLWTCSPGATASVNRRNLGSGGSESKFVITVKAADGKTKSEYIVWVRRGQYNREPGGPGIAPILLDLVPSSGELSPEFSPDHYSYTIQVPYEVQKMEFETRQTEGASVSVNRKNLGSGGSTVDFIITVSMGSQKTKYTVSVTRGAYSRDGGSTSKSSSKSSGGKTTQKNGSSSGEEMDISGEISPENGAEVTETAPLIIRNDSILPFMLGAVTVLAAVFAGIAAVLLFRGKRSKK